MALIADANPETLVPVADVTLNDRAGVAASAKIPAVTVVDQTGAAVQGAPGSTAANPNANPSAMYVRQQAVTAAAAALPAGALVNGVTVRAKTGNTGPVFVGTATVNTTDTGAGTGFKLLAGESVTIQVTNASSVFIIGTAADVVYAIGT